MKVFNILLVTAVLLILAAGSSPQTAGAQAGEDGKGKALVNKGLRIQLDIKPTSLSGSILFERGPHGEDSHRSIELSVVRGEEAEPPSMTRSIQDRFKAMRIITRVAARLLEKALFTLL
jgi:hypothetical protein